MWTPRRFIDAMCARHRACERWPVAGGYTTLAAQCLDCDAAGHAIQDERGLWLRLLPDLPANLLEHQAAIHEAAHAVIGIATGHPLRVITVADNGGGEGMQEPGGFVKWGPWGSGEIFLIGHLAMVWAGQVAGMRWLREHGLDTDANLVDIRVGASDDARQAYEATADYGSAPDLGWTLAVEMVDHRWDDICRLADQLRVRRTMTGADVALLLDGATRG